MATFSATALHAQLCDEIDGYGMVFTGTATISGATFTSTDARLLALLTNADPHKFEGRYAYIPSGTVGTDQVHNITTIAVVAGTATITTDRNYAATYTAVSMKILYDHPDILRNLFNDALDKLMVECAMPIGHLPNDAAMQDSGVTDWTGTATTIAKQTTAAEVFRGARSLNVVSDGASQYVQSALYAIGQGRTGYLMGILKADIGTTTLAALDASGNVQASVALTQEEWLFVRKQVQMDSADEQVRIRATLTASADECDLQAAWFVKSGVRRFALPSYADARIKVKGLARAVFHETGAEADTWIAGSMELETLTENLDYRYSYRGADANPNAIVLTRDTYITEPLFVILDCPWSAPYGVSATFSVDTNTTLCPEPLLVAYCKMLIGRREPGNWPGLEAEGAAEVRERSRNRATALPLKAPAWRGSYRRI